MKEREREGVHSDREWREREKGKYREIASKREEEIETKELKKKKGMAKTKRKGNNK